MEIARNIADIREQVGKDVTLVAVSKTKPVEAILEAYEAGQRDFGENYIQELTDKYEQLPKDIRWHMIGHVQTNKVKYIAPFVYLIHGVDSLKLLKEINKQAAKNNRVIDCLLQVHIAQEETKFGFDPGEIMDILKNPELDLLQNICIRGLMTMGSNTEDVEQVEREFREVETLFRNVKEKRVKTENVLPEFLSMGMSGDYELAVKCGSNMIRVGSRIFGERIYNKAE